MKWRNQLLALFCLLVFFAFGVFYFQHWVVQKPFGIILFIGEGLSASELTAARLYAGGAEHTLALDSLPYTALLRNHSIDSATPDQAAAATSLATGVKVKNGSIGVDGDGKALANLVELARASGRMTGLVTNGNLTDPSLASFYGHTSNENDWQDLARALVEDAEVDVILGGGSTFFRASGKGGERSDERDLLTESQDAGYDLAQSAAELEEIPRWRRAKLFGVFADRELPFSRKEGSHDDAPSLADLVRRSIELLQFNSGGYLLVVDAALMRKAAREKNAEQTLVELLELDHAVSVALEYAGNKSAIFVCGDVEIRGPDLSGFADHAFEAENAGQGRSVTAAEPIGAEAGGDERAQVEDISASKAPDMPGNPLTSSTEDSFGSRVSAAENVASDVLAFGGGLGADGLHGTLENTRIFELIRDSF